ncbi:alkaline phosphatase [Kiritimatiella glycovorans]|uniref:Alkaline phosphatase 3 n=1 Tax=Kiritimatiella glycovorans TaxID=1307763 RepID=A0A0G3EJT8_9BACT|nr:alkaline phosphatase [Kiritimatiella glycovorans]AKJ65055.1 Alkaline phosphatase 3 precursor [Kiritimatiella glycovorans]
MTINKPIIRIALLALLLTTCAARAAQAPRNVILMIGDGMGVAQLTAGKIAAGELEMERIRTLGLMTTHSANALVTDSAAAGTALATGHKTDNGVLAQTPDGKPLRTVLEAAEERGLKTGLVTSCSLTHATPAAFGAHVPDRDRDVRIAEQVAACGVDVLFGGGAKFFRAHFESMRGEGFTIVTTEEAWNVMGAPARAAAFLAEKHPPRITEGRVPLEELTRRALLILEESGPGFFLMVEASQIDWGGHANDTEFILSEMLDFDRAVGACLDFAESEGDTLVLVTSDHECGGMAVHDGSVEDRTVTECGYTTGYHTAVMVPLFAFGPGSEAFRGVLDNTEVGARLLEWAEGIR